MKLYHVSTRDELDIKANCLWVCRNKYEWWPFHLSSEELKNYKIFELEVADQARIKTFDIWNEYCISVEEYKNSKDKLNFDIFELVSANDQLELSEMAILNCSVIDHINVCVK